MLLTRREVEALVKLSRTRIYILMKENRFPRPIRVGMKAVRWRSEDLESWLASRPEAGPSTPAYPEPRPAA